MSSTILCIHFGMSVDLISFQLILEQSWCWDSKEVACNINWRCIFRANFLNLHILQSCFPSCSTFLNLVCFSIVYICVGFIVLYFRCLWSINCSTFVAKRKFPEVWRLYLFVDRRQMLIGCFLQMQGKGTLIQCWD